ncbi:DUF6588 family protein [Rufibacter radiotolerans]|nr:DUF6588 family protein [Rufibacter radiotolerans]
MKKNTFKVSFFALFLLVSCLTGSAAHAQEEVGDFIRAGKADANKLIRAYAEPASKAFGHGLNGGWFNSGQALKLGRFDIRVFATASFAPDEDKTFDLATLGLSSNVKFDGSRSTIAPTIFGEAADGPELRLFATNPTTKQQEEIARFNSPQGSGYDLLPVPMAQVSLGLVANTEVAVRFSPKVKYDDFEGELWGVGAKHGLKQWIPVINEVEGFDIALTGGYTNLKSSYTGIDVQVAEEDRSYATSQQLDPSYYSGQAVKLTTKAWTTSLIASKTLGILNVYAGVRYSNVETDLNLEGRYPVLAYKTTLPNNKYIEDITNPIMLNMQDSQWGATGGLRLKLAVLSLYGEYTIAKYPTATAGIGIGFY